MIHEAYDSLTSLDSSDSFFASWLANPHTPEPFFPDFETCSLLLLQRNAPFDLKNAGHLSVLRYEALRANHEPGMADEAEKQELVDAIYRHMLPWLRYLASEESSSGSFFLQEFLCKDSTFYDDRTYQPRNKPENCWADRLSFLGEPQHLTIAELELALTIFDWSSDEKKPRFTWWLRHRPAILWRLHEFLLKRYCFQLLEAFHLAAKKDGLEKPPYRAGELWRWYPRVAGLTAIGFLGVLSLDPLVALLFAAPWWMAVLLAALALVSLGLLIFMDVFKQNRGLMVSRQHAAPRVRGLMTIFIAWGLVASAIFAWLTLVWPTLAGGAAAFYPFEGQPLANLVVVGPPLGWPLALRFLPGLLGLGLLSAALGALLQWFWEDRAATEPI